MPQQPRHYCLTQAAERDFREARKWSVKRWGKEQTKQYFQDLHQSAERLGEQLVSVESITCVAEASTLMTFPVREHYIVYLPIAKQRIAIVALIRQTRDVPAILQANQFQITKALASLTKK